MLVVTSVMFTFISFWRTAAIVLCDLASTAYYIGGIVESQIGRAAPWFILAVMLFSYAVRSVYIESCSMFVRGGVYRIVKEAMGSGPARLAVSAPAPRCRCWSENVMIPWAHPWMSTGYRRSLMNLAAPSGSNRRRS